MKFRYHPDTDSLYIDLADRPGVDAEEVRPGVVFDFDADGKLVGIDIEHASGITDVTALADATAPIAP